MAETPEQAPCSIHQDVISPAREITQALAQAMKWGFPGTGQPQDFPALLLGEGEQARRGIHDRGLLAQGEHGQISGAIGIAVGVLQLVAMECGGIEFTAQARDLVPALVVDQIGKQRQSLFREIHHGAEAEIEAENATDFLDVGLRTGGNQHREIPVTTMPLQPLQHFRPDAGRNPLGGKASREILDFRAFHLPQKTQKHPLHALGPEDGREGCHQQKERKIPTSCRMPLQHVVAKKFLRIPGQQGAIEVKQGDLAGRG